MNVIMKSGTNEFHGSAFEFCRDTFLNTRNFFSLRRRSFTRISLAEFWMDPSSAIISSS